VRPPTFFEFNGDAVAPGMTRGQQSWLFRALDFAVCVSWLSEGEVLSEAGTQDEQALLIPHGLSVVVSANSGAPESVMGPAFVSIPAGSWTLVCEEPGFVARVVSGHERETLARARNSSSYADVDPEKQPWAPGDPSAARQLRVWPVPATPPDTPREGVLFRTESLLIHWLFPWVGSGDVTSLTPRVHDRCEKMTVTLSGEHVHHVRKPWTTCLREWRPDEHVQVLSPSVAIIPPGNMHATRAVGPGLNQAFEIFPAHRLDVDEMARVANSDDYD
jgi:hypothetical protein